MIIFKFKKLCAFLITLVAIASCSNSIDQQDKSAVVSFKLNLNGLPSKTVPQARAVTCSSGFSTIEAYIYDDRGNLLAQGGPWDCEAHSGAVRGSVAGDNRHIVIIAKDENDCAGFRGDKFNLNFIANQENNAGEIDLSLVDCDKTNLGVALSAGDSHYAYIDGQGRLWMAGFNSSGQLGDGTNERRAQPVLVNSDTDWVSVMAGYNHTIAIKSNGSLWRWGNDNLGFSYNTPQRFGSDASWVKIATDAYQNFGIKQDGSLWAWGLNANGQLGTGTNITEVAPVQIGDESDWYMVSANAWTTFAIKNNGTLWGWGRNINGELPVEVNADVLSPIQIGTSSDWVEIDTNTYNTIARKADGSMWTFTGGERQIGTSFDWRSLSAGYSFQTAINENGQLWSWGINHAGQVGDGSFLFRTDPVLIDGSTDWLIVDSASSHSLAIKMDGSLWGWGHNSSGVIQPRDSEIKNTPLQFTDETNWSSVQAANMHGVVSKLDGSIWTWGYNAIRSSGNGSFHTNLTPALVSENGSWREYAVGYNNTFVIQNDNVLTAFGFATPWLSGMDTDWATISAKLSALAIKSNGTLWAWGWNSYGQIGDGTTERRDAPVQIGSDVDWQSVFAGVSNSFAIKSDGTLWAWGANSSGMLGDGTTINKTSPVQIGTDTDWRMVVGSLRTYALKTDNTLWEWGGGKNSPVQLETDTDWQTIASGVQHALGLKTNGTLWAWGVNSHGELGVGNYTNVWTPVQIGTDNDWQAIAAGNAFSVAIKMDGSMWKWGYGDDFLGAPILISDGIAM